MKLGSLEAVHQWVADAKADGWKINPLYGRESVERAARLTREGGWVAHAIARPKGELNETAEVSVWGPDGLWVNARAKYSFESLVESTRSCPECGANDVATERVGFANRCCANCAPTLKSKIETPGWAS